MDELDCTVNKGASSKKSTLSVNLEILLYLEIFFFFLRNRFHICIIYEKKKKILNLHSNNYNLNKINTSVFR